VAKHFYLYARERVGNPPVWYARFRSEEGQIGSPVCTGQTDRDRAQQWATDFLLKGGAVAARRPRAPTFEQWAEPWWDYERCPYIAEKLADGFPMSRNYAKLRRAHLHNYLIPALGKRRISELKPKDFRDLKLQLIGRGDLAPATVNVILGTARVMFGYAVKMGELETSPVAPVTELKEVPRERGILSVEELRALFGVDALENVWRGDLRHFACNLLAATTGLRLGECQGLQVQYVHPQFVRVIHSWSDTDGLSSPKWNSARLVPIPGRTSAALSQLIGLGRWGDPQPEDVVFWGRDRHTPLSKTSILEQFKNALKKIGIPEEQRRGRNLLFHGYRHGFNTMIRGRVADEQLRRVTGHKTMAMTDNYDAPGIEQLQDVLREQEKLFGPG
jgi:integrase